MLLNSLVFPSLTHVIKVGANPFSLNVPVMVIGHPAVSNYGATDRVAPRLALCKANAGIWRWPSRGLQKYRGGLAMCKRHKALSQTIPKQPFKLP